MSKLQIGVLVLLSGVLIFGGIFLIPAQYDVAPFKARAGTQYWHLATGSEIGFTKVGTNAPEKKAPIIYLHGGPGGRVHDEVIEVLSPLSQEGHDLYFYDQIGSGHSARLTDIAQYSVARHREDLAQIIARIGVDQVILIGHSWGACLAIDYLQAYPETVDKVILTGPGPILPINRAMAKVSPPDSLKLFAPAFSNAEGNEKVYNWRSKIIWRWAYMFNAKLVADSEVDGFFTLLNEELSKSTDCDFTEPKRYPGGGGYYSHVMTVKSFRRVEDRRNRLRELNTPVLIIRGQCDNQQWGYAKEYLDLLVNAELQIMEGVGHDIIKKKSGAYYDMVLDFLAND